MPRPVPTPIVHFEEELMEAVLGPGSYRIGLVTPEIASWLLKMNTGNRPPRTG